LTELAETSGREKLNLPRTLKTMGRYGIVHFEKGAGREVASRVNYSGVSLEMSFAQRLHHHYAARDTPTGIAGFCVPGNQENDGNNHGCNRQSMGVPGARPSRMRPGGTIMRSAKLMCWQAA
jgi:hypothetical protein